MIDWAWWYLCMFSVTAALVKLLVQYNTGRLPLLYQYADNNFHLHMHPPVAHFGSSRENDHNTIKCSM